MNITPNKTGSLHLLCPCKVIKQPDIFGHQGKLSILLFLFYQLKDRI